MEEQTEHSTISERFKNAHVAFMVPMPIGARDWSEVLPAEVCAGE